MDKRMDNHEHQGFPRLRGASQRPPQSAPNRYPACLPVGQHFPREPMGAGPRSKHSRVLACSVSHILFAGRDYPPGYFGPHVQPGQRPGRAKGLPRMRGYSKAVQFTPSPSRGRALRSTNAVKSTCYAGAQARTGQRVTACSGVSMKGNGAPFPFSHKTEEGKNERSLKP